MMKGCKGFVTNLQVLNQYTLGNQMPFIAKELSKEIMKRARLVKIFLRNGMAENKIFCNRQRNYSVSLLQKFKRGYYKNLNIRSVTNKLFWKSIYNIYFWINHA